MRLELAVAAFVVTLAGSAKAQVADLVQQECSEANAQRLEKHEYRWGSVDCACVGAAMDKSLDDRIKALLLKLQAMPEINEAARRQAIEDAGMKATAYHRALSDAYNGALKACGGDFKSTWTYLCKNSSTGDHEDCDCAAAIYEAALDNTEKSNVLDREEHAVEQKRTGHGRSSLWLGFEEAKANKVIAEKCAEP